MAIDDLVNSIKSGDAQSSNNSFNSIMADKINAALDTAKQSVASKMYGEQEVETSADTETEAEQPEEVTGSEEV